LYDLNPENNPLAIAFYYPARISNPNPSDFSRFFSGSGVTYRDLDLPVTE